jgi:hypothetical protein
MKPYLGDRGIRKIEILCLSDSLRLRGRDIFATGNFIFFKGIKLFIQPTDQKDHIKPGCIPSSDIVWLDHKSKIENCAFNPETKIVLYANQGEPPKFLANYPGQNFVAMNQSVRLGLDNSNLANKNGMLCNYFNQAE